MFRSVKNHCPLSILILFLSAVVWWANCPKSWAQTVQYIEATPGTKQQDIIIISFPVQGWYLISLPLTVSDNSVSTLFPAALNGVAFSWQTDQYVSVTSIETGRGYWIAIPGPTAAVIEGDPVTQFNGHFNQGWHLIGSVIGSVDFSDPNDDPDGSVLVPIFRWNGDEQRYSPPAFDVEQSFGHWVAVVQETDLTVQGNSGVLALKRVNPAAVEAFQEKFGAAPPPPPFELKERLHALVPKQPLLLGNYPNPFNPETVIRYNIAEEGLARLTIYNSLGQEIRVLVDEFQLPGTYAIQWDGRDFRGRQLVSGVYFYRLYSNNNFSETKRMILLR